MEDPQRRGDIVPIVTARAPMLERMEEDFWLGNASWDKIPVCMQPVSFTRGKE